MDATVGIPPAVTEETEVFWAAANEGRLIVERCDACGAYAFPPRGMCRSCRSRTMSPVAVTGPGHLYSFTVNHQRWLPDLEVPYAVALVEFDGFPGIRIPARLRGCNLADPAAVTIGMPVEIGFEPGPGGQAIPSFVVAPADAPALRSSPDDIGRPTSHTMGATSDGRPPRPGQAGHVPVGDGRPVADPVVTEAVPPTLRDSAGDAEATTSESPIGASSKGTRFETGFADPAGIPPLPDFGGQIDPSDDQPPANARSSGLGEVSGYPVLGQEKAERRAVISGVGQSAIGRQIDRSGFQLTIDAITAAVADAGLALEDIDGLAMFPGGGQGNVPGYSGGNLYEVQDALRLTTSWRQGQVEGMSLPFYGPVQAVAAGQARHVVVYRTVKEGSTARNAGGRPAYGSTKPLAEGPQAWLIPAGMLSPVCQVAPFATRYMHDHRVTREQLAWIPVTQRAHASRNPDAVYQQPLTVDDYMASRMISTPMCLFDCDVPIDGATAIVISAADTAADLRSPVGLEAMAGVIDGRPSWDQWEDMSRVGHATAQALWNRTDLRPTDVDTAQLYDGFTIEVVWWLEALGFCGPGEAGAFVEGGKRIGLDGDLPLNTWGGQLSGGRLHAAFGHTAEAVRQLRGEAGDRQVRDAEVAVVTNVGGYEAGAALLTRWP